jgi:hypothetical protein
MTPTPAQLRAEIDRWKQRQVECRLLARSSPRRSDRRDFSIEAAFAAVIVGALAYALGDSPSPAVRIKFE